MPAGKIRVAKYNYKTKTCPLTPNYENILIHTTGPLSPYIIKDENGVIFENYWQFSKIWKTVDAITQPVSTFQPHLVRWQHGAETHLNNHGEITPEYWAWRQKGFASTRWVRYPNGYKNHPKAVGSVIVSTLNDSNGSNDPKIEIVGYIEARKRIYLKKYQELLLKTPAFFELVQKVQQGQNIQIVEVDGPTWANEHPYNLVENHSLEMNKDIIDALLENPLQAFGHGYALASTILQSL